MTALVLVAVIRKMGDATIHAQDCHRLARADSPVPHRHPQDTLPGDYTCSNCLPAGLPDEETSDA